MAILQIFKSKVSSVSYFFKNGKQAPFINGKFITDIESEIEELMADIGAIGSDKSKHPHLYVDPNEKELDTEAPTYEETIRAQERTKVLAEIAATNAAALVPSNNVSTSDSGNAAASFTSTAALGGLDGSTPVPVPVFTDIPAPVVPATPAETAAVSLISADLQSKLASLTGTIPAAGTSATVSLASTGK